MQLTAINRRDAITGAAATAGALCFSPALAQRKPKVAFTLLFAPGGEVGWDPEHMRGVQMARDFHGDRVQIDTFHEIAEWGNGDKEVFQKLVADGYEMIFTTSAGYMQSTIEVAHEAPNVLFENCAGYIRSKNVATYNARWYEGRSVQGFLAGTVSKTGRIGYLGAYPIPQVTRGINSAFLAARSVNPDIEFDIVWLNEWFNPEKEAKVARELLERGCDVLMQHTVSTAAVEIAQDAGAFSFGQSSDMAKYGKDAVLTSMINNWGPYYTQRIGQFLDGTWRTADTWAGIGQDMVSLGTLLDTLPNRTHLQTDDVIKRISDGQQHAFVGPIRKQDGSGWLAPGETASDSDLLTMDYYVEGISSVFPGKG